ncbi:MAG: CoA transferase [Dehalococcoidia bacterium]
MALPLEGIKVVDLSTWLMAPCAAAILADYGAEVVKIEDPDGGDFLRGIMSAGPIEPTDINFPLELVNRNKKSVAVNLKTEKGKEIVYKLVERSDIFISNLRRPSLGRLAMDYPTLSRLNPSLIYAHISGYGPKGPDKNRPAFDELAYWARGGFMSVLGEPDSLPVPLHGAMGDLPSGAITVSGIMMALYHRERTGEGQEVNCSLYECGLWANGWDVQHGLVTGEDVPRSSRSDTGHPLYNIYQTQDGGWVFLNMLHGDHYWADTCKALGLEELITDPRFDTHERRVRNSKEAIALIDATILTKDRDEWATIFDQHNLVWAPAASIKEIIQDPQAWDNDYFVEMDHPSGKPLKLIAAPFQLTKTPSEVKTSCPELGQHTREVLETLGYRGDEIEGLKAQKVIL